MTTSPQVVQAFETIDGELAVGGVPLTRLAARAGSTPFFAYDRAQLTDRVASIRAALPPRVHLSYAVKANPMPAIVQHLAGLVDRFDVASGNELRTALDTPLGPSRVSFAGPGKSDVELSQAVAAGVTIELESAGEAQRMLRVADQLSIRPRAAIRVNPDFQVKGSGMRMGGGPQQFGVDSEKVPSLIADLSSADVELVGFHVFAGSQNLSADVLVEAQRKTAELVVRLSDSLPEPVRYVNIGGGLGIPYFANEKPLDLQRVGEGLHAILADVVEPALPQAQVVMELGRYIVGECGVYVTRVVDRKESRGQVFLVVDGGLHHQLAASGNFGQVIRRNYPLVIGNRVTEASTEVSSVVGCSCTPLDLLGDKVDLPHAEVGDLVTLFQAGAYGLTASPTAFLSHSEAVELVV